MQKIIFTSSITKQYNNIKKQIHKNYKIIDILKLLLTIFILLLTVGVYGYFVNVSSTKGYFLRQEMKKFEDTKFAYSVSQLEILNLQKKNWDNIQSNNIINEKKIKIRSKIVFIPYFQNLAYRKN